MTFTVWINGTDTNPYHQYGLRQNPFPQIAKQEYCQAMMALNRLGAEPIRDTDQIRQILTGFSPEFIEGCCKRFVKGEMVEFEASFPGEL